MGVLLLSAGSNAHGQLANGTLQDSIQFAPAHFIQPHISADGDQLKTIGNLPQFAQRILNVATGANHTLVLLQSRETRPVNHVYGSGDNSRGQLGASSSTSQANSTISTDSAAFRPITLQFESAKDYHVVDVAAAWDTSFFVLRHRTLDSTKSDILISMGGNDFGDLGVLPPPSATKPLPATPSRKGKERQTQRRQATTAMNEHIVDFDHILPLGDVVYRIEGITTGVHHIVVQLAFRPGRDGSEVHKLVGWGSHRQGQLGPVASPKPSPVKSSKSPPFFQLPVDLTPDPTSLIARVAAGSQHTVLLHSGGNLTAWGSKRKNQLAGLNDGLIKASDVGCTWNGTYLVVQKPTDATIEPPWTILATGASEKGQLGRALPTSASSSSSPTQPPEPSAPPVLAPVQFPFDRGTRSLQKLACGSEHVLALLNATESAQTELWAWGWNEHGNLGLGHQDDVAIPAPVDVSTHGGKVVDAWAGCGTSWIAMEVDGERIPA